MTETTVWKLTDQNMRTYNGYQWTLDTKHIFPGVGPLCTFGWCHAYLSAQLAVLLAPIHVMFDPPRLFEGRGVVGAHDFQLKVGCSSLTLGREIKIPEITVRQRIAFGLNCALAVYQEEFFVRLAKKWLSSPSPYISEEEHIAVWTRTSGKTEAQGRGAARAAETAHTAITRAPEDAGYWAGLAAERAARAAADVGTTVDLIASAEAALQPWAPWSGPGLVCRIAATPTSPP